MEIVVKNVLPYNGKNPRIRGFVHLEAGPFEMLLAVRYHNNAKGHRWCFVQMPGVFHDNKWITQVRWKDKKKSDEFQEEVKKQLNEKFPNNGLFEVKKG